MRNAALLFTFSVLFALAGFYTTAFGIERYFMDEPVWVAICSVAALLMFAIAGSALMDTMTEWDHYKLLKKRQERYHQWMRESHH